MKKLHFITRFYVEGFKSMTWGRRLWLIILVKLFIMFFILKIFFFQNFLDTRCSTEEEKSNYVMEQLIDPKH